MVNEQIWKIVLTGGPCGGKTEGIKHLVKHLPEHRITPLAMNELATQLFNNGFNIAEVMRDKNTNKRFQSNLMDLKSRLEWEWKKLLEINPGFPLKLLICDRGRLDDRVYMTEEDFQNILRLSGRKNVGDLLDDCGYMAVYHMASAAVEAEEAYLKFKADNPARRESLEEARDVEVRTRVAWVEHRRRRIIGNAIDEQKISFEEKLDILLDLVVKDAYQAWKTIVGVAY